MLPHVVLAEESKNGLRFEIGPSYDVVPTRSQLVIDGHSSCNRFCALICKILRFEKHVTVLLCFNWGIRYQQNDASLRKNTKNWPSADKRAWCDGIWLSTAECVMTHFMGNPILANANTKELDGAQTNRHDGIWPSLAECRWLPNILIAYTHLLARRKWFRKSFYVPKVFETSKIWFSLKIAAVQDYWQQRSVENVRFS